MKREFKFAAKVWGYYLVMTLLCLVFTLGISQPIVRLVMDLGLLLGFTYICFSEGGYLGEKAVALVDSIQKQEKEGRRVLDELRGQVFSKKFAVASFLICILPFMVVCGLNAAYYPTYSQQAIVEEADMPAAETQETIADAQTAEAAEEIEDGRPVHWARILAWTVMTPFATFNQMCSDALNAVLFFLYSMLLPGAAMAGYLCGPMLHRHKIKMMKKGSRRKARGLKVHKTPKPPKPEV